MKRSLFLLAMAGGVWAGEPAEWSHYRNLVVAQPGLVSYELAPDSLEVASPGLSDLRIWDAQGKEVPYLFDRGEAESERTVLLDNVRTRLGDNATRVTARLDQPQVLTRLRVLTPAPVFLKGVDVEGSRDGQEWFPLARRQVLFREENHAENLDIDLSTATIRLLKLSIDDQRSKPIAVTGLWAETVGKPPRPGLDYEVKILSRAEGPGESRLTLELPSRNLEVASILLASPEKLFSRSLRIAVPAPDPQVFGALTDETLGNGSVYRIAMEGVKQERLEVPLESIVPGKILTLVIANGDSPPLAVDAIRIRARLPRVVFRAARAETFKLTLGRPNTPAPRYDLTALRGQLLRLPAMAPSVGDLVLNPAKKTPPPPYYIPEIGGDFSPAGWRRRASVTLQGAGLVRLELSLRVLALARKSGADLRLVRDGRQVPYVLDRSAGPREITPVAEHLSEDHKRNVSRWEVRLPEPGLPATHVSFDAKERLFQRPLRLLEERKDTNGQTVTFELARTVWSRAGEENRRMILEILEPPQGARLILEMENGDNAPLSLTDFRLYYRPVAMLFKTSTTDALWLYYDNPEASPPRYDIQLAADALLMAPAQGAAIGPEGTAEAGRWQSAVQSKEKVIFWVVLVLVAGVLLAILSRLLPEKK